MRLHLFDYACASWTHVFWGSVLTGNASRLLMRRTGDGALRSIQTYGNPVFEQILQLLPNTQSGMN